VTVLYNFVLHLIIWNEIKLLTQNCFHNKIQWLAMTIFSRVTWTYLRPITTINVKLACVIGHSRDIIQTPTLGGMATNKSMLAMHPLSWISIILPAKKEYRRASALQFAVVQESKSKIYGFKKSQVYNFRDSHILRRLHIYISAEHQCSSTWLFCSKTRPIQNDNCFCYTLRRCEYIWVWPNNVVDLFCCQQF
jgi:hypothetical protein